MITFWILFIITFVGTFYVMPHSIRKIAESGSLANDMYKPGQPAIPTNAGMIILFTSFISLALLPLIVRVLNLATPLEESVSDLSKMNLAFLLVVSIYALYGLVDDLLDIGRKLKLILPVAFGYPLISVLSPESVWIPFWGIFDLTSVFFGDITWSDLFRVTVIPVYVMVVTNLVNMHSGYNGLQSGLSIIVTSTLLVKSWMDGILDTVMPGGAFLGAMVALLWFNKYPARVFEGNIGSLLFGSVIGCIIVIQEYWWFGFFIMIPHTANFLLWIVWLLMMRRHPEVYLEGDGKHKKFGRVREDGTLEVPNRLTLKWIPNYYFRLGENKSVCICCLTTLFFCILGFIIF
jgi:UDP-N-acetylglucosamine--dolichyl-phosphate N-acetylglucosaminephosphotransferase